MNATHEVDSTLTERYQTTVPAQVRRVLGLGKRDKIHYSIRDNGEVVLTRAVGAQAEDPVMLGFLSFLERDLHDHPERIQPLTAASVARARELTAGIDVDLDEPLSEDNE
ncbi:type II toxin-antitoxin system PrlF family antitoxin [Halomonas sp. WWR20]